MVANAIYDIYSQQLVYYCNGKKVEYRGNKATAQYSYLLETEIIQLTEKVSELYKWYSNPDNFDKKNWHDIKSQYDALQIKICAKKDHYKNFLSRIFALDIDTDPIGADVFVNTQIKNL